MNKLTYITTLLIAAITVIISAACANRGSGPQGGPKDVTPPVLLECKPEYGTLNYKENTLTLLFDEIVQVQSAMEKVVVSPPQVVHPTVKSVGKKVIVQFDDTLQNNVSYTIDFNDAIIDNNERNPMKPFSLAFSTGDVLDTMQVTGTLLDATNLSPLQGVIVGIHNDLSDTAFTDTIFNRVSKTDKFGRFTIYNISPGEYKIYALQDIGSNFRFDYPSELIAFSDSIITPSVSTQYHTDTTWIGEGDTARVDTIISSIHSIYKPDSIILYAFVEDPKRQFIAASTRKKRHAFVIEFAMPLDSLPTLNGLNFNADSSIALMPNPTLDTITYWITDTALMSQDSLITTLEYPKADSLGVNVLTTDTIVFVYRMSKQEREEAKKRKKTKDTVSKVEFVDLATNIKSTYDFFLSPRIEFTIPTTVDSLSKCRIEEKVDTLWKTIPGIFQPLDSIGLQYTFGGNLKPGKDYRLVVDSATFTTILGLHNDKKQLIFKTKALEDYGLIKINLTNATGKERVQLLSEKDEVLCEQPVNNGVVVFSYLMPKKYYLRLYIDTDGNGKWTNGEYKQKRQPESIYYFPYNIEVRAFWDIEEEWNYLEFPVDEQKPRELIVDGNNK